MALKRFLACLPGGRGQTLDESGLGEGAETTFILICEEMSVCRGIVDQQVVTHGPVWIRWVRVGAPVDVFTL